MVVSKQLCCWWELEVRQMLGVVLWSVSEALRAAGQRSTAIHQSVTTALLIANALGTFCQLPSSSGQWSVAATIQGQDLRGQIDCLGPMGKTSLTVHRSRSDPEDPELNKSHLSRCPVYPR